MNVPLPKFISHKMKIIGCIILLLSVAQTFGANEECKGNPNKKDPEACCDVPMISEEIFDKCFDIYKKQTEKQDELKVAHGCCTSECAFNETKIYKGNGILDKDVLAKVLLDKGGPAWRDIIPNVVEQCFKDAAENADAFKNAFESPPAFDGEKVCHPISGYILLCLHNEAFQKCPDSIFPKGDAECVALKKYAEKCSLIYPG